MEKSEVIDNLLAEVCLDERIPTGVFEIDKPEHIQILRETATKLYGGEFANALCESLMSTMVDEGNYPERQAYNKDGILVTFPDQESKKAALDRGSHFESDPTGGSGGESDESEDNESEEETDKPDMFDDYENPEDKVAGDEEDSLFYGEEEDEIFLKDDPEYQGDVHHVYDILKNIKTAQDDDPETNDVTPEGKVIVGELHPTILFALKQKWVFDKGGNWHDETGKFRASTDRRGQLDPSNKKDKEEMLIWLDDYLKKRKSVDE